MLLPCQPCAAAGPRSAAPLVPRLRCPAPLPALLCAVISKVFSPGTRAVTLRLQPDCSAFSWQRKSGGVAIIPSNPVGVKELDVKLSAALVPKKPTCMDIVASSGQKKEDELRMCCEDRDKKDSQTSSRVFSLLPGCDKKAQTYVTRGGADVTYSSKAPSISPDFVKDLNEFFQTLHTLPVAECMGVKLAVP